MARSLWDDLDQIDARLARSPRWLLACDFDGTLAPPADSPGAGSMSGRARGLLRALARTGRACVAVVSDRALGDLRDRVGLPELIYVGSHGLEMAGAGWSFVEPEAARRSEALKGLCVELNERLRGWDGAEVEYRGLTASVRYGRVSPLARTLVCRTVEDAVRSRRDAFQVNGTRTAKEIRPLVAWGKCSAVVELAPRACHPDSAVVYLSSEGGEEDLFLLLPDAVTVHVGEGETAARWGLRDPGEVEAFLEHLVQAEEG